MQLLSEFVRYYDNVLSDKLCDDIIDYYESNLDLEFDAVTGLNDYKTDLRNSKTVPILFGTNLDLILCESIANTVFSYIESINKSFKEKSDFNFTDALPQELTSDVFLVNKYSEGEYYKWHCDQSSNFDGTLESQRILSVLFYLNDSFEGGETKFLFGDIKPKKGSCLLFPSNFMFPHYSFPITKGVKYSLASWLSPKNNNDV